MNRIAIAPKDFIFDQSIISKRWLLLTAGEFAPGKFNSMTISWGSVGEIWNRPFFQVVVRPQRFCNCENDAPSCCSYRPAVSLWYLSGHRP